MNLTSEQHREILERYRRTQTDTGWHNAPDDGYLYDHLVHHLLEAGLTDELKGLFADHQWLHARVPQSNYLYDGYLTDLQTAWNIAYTTCKRQIEQKLPLTALVDCFRYALIRTSINSIVADYPPELVARAIELDIWTTERALSIAERAPNLELYDALLKTGKLDAEHQAKYIQSGHEQVIRHRDSLQNEEIPEWPPSPTVYRFLHDLVTMLPHFDEHQRSEALDFDLKWLFGYDWGKASWHPQILEKVVPYLSSSQIQSAIEIAFGSFRKNSRPITLAILAAYVDQIQQQEIAQQAYAIALESQSNRNIAHGIAAILPYLSDYLRDDALKQGLEAAEKDKHSSSRVEALRRFIPLVPEEQRNQFIEYVFTQAKKLEPGYAPGTHLAQLFPHLDMAQKAEAFEQILNIRPNSGENLATILSELYPYLTTEQQQKAMKTAYETAVPQTEAHQKMYLLASVSSYVSREYMETSLSDVIDFDDEEGYIQSVALLMPLVTNESKEKLTRWVFTRINKSRVSSFPIFNARIVESIASALPSDLLKIAYDKAIAASYGQRTRQLVSILPYRDKRESEEALEKTLTDRHIYISLPLHRELAELVPALVGEVREQAVQIALDEILQIQPPQEDHPNYQGENRRYYQENRGLFDLSVAESIKKLGAYLSREQVQIAYRILVERIKTPLCRAEGFIGLIPYLDGQQLKYAVQHCFETASQNNFRPIREDILEPVLPYLDDGFRKELLQYIFETSDIVNAVLIVCKLVPHLPEKERLQALQWAFWRSSTMLNHNNQRPAILSRLAPILDMPERARAVQRAFEDLHSNLPEHLDEVQHHLSILARLAKIADEPTAIIQAMQRLMLESLAARLEGQRTMIYPFIDMILADVGAPLLTDEIHAAIAEQIIDVCENWQWI